MSSLKEKLQEIFSDYPEFWNYYMNSDGEINEHDARRFIKKYFEHASKQSVVTEWLKLQDCNDSMRYQHSVIVFFIGAMIQREIDEDLYIRSEELINGRNIHYPFSYLWFLTCLGHDIGYQVEIYSHYQRGDIREEYENDHHNKKRFFSVSNIYKRLKKKELNIVPSKGRLGEVVSQRNSISPNRGFRKNRMCASHCYDKNIVYSNYSVISKRWYSLDIQYRYFKMRFFEEGLIDHGITGADYLHEKLLDNYKRAEENRNNGTYENFEDENGKHFGIEQWRIFQYICDCIAAHNMYRSGTEVDGKMQYKKYGLECLWSENFRKISYKEDPLLFILCIADTLEPTKRFGNNNRTLDKIIIDYEKESNTLIVHVDDDLGTEEQKADYIRGVQQLEEWVDINVELKRM